MKFYQAISRILVNLDESQNEVVNQDILIPSFSKSYCTTSFPEIINGTSELEDEDDQIASV